MHQSEDPGWPLNRRALLGLLFPPLLEAELRRRPTGATPVIALLRGVFVAFTVALMLYLLVLVFVLPFRDTVVPAPPIVWPLLAASVVAAFAARWAANRPLSCGDTTELANQYRATFFMGVAFSEAAALFGFVAAFIAGGFWPYLATLGIGGFGFRQIAPTAAHVERTEQRLILSGCATSLRAALFAPPPGNERP